jgi:hypothetical protein
LEDTKKIDVINTATNASKRPYVGQPSPGRYGSVCRSVHHNVKRFPNITT